MTAPVDRFERRAVLERVIDGDTAVLRISLGFDVWVERTIRLVGVDTPETHTTNPDEKQKGLAAARFTRMWLDDAWICAEDPVLPLIIRSVTASDKYGRTLARVWRDDGHELSRDLIDAGHGKLYHGGKK